MKRSWVAALAIVCLVGLSGAVSAQEEPQQKKKSPEKTFAKLDTDGNGSLSLEEYVGKKEGDAVAKAEANFKKLDKDSDGSLTLEEFKERAKMKSGKEG
jgi:Ca2+-binding EF-hand superfamily protein